MFTRVQWAKDLMQTFGNGNPSPQVLKFIVGWSTEETNTNSGARFNLLNTTEPYEGATNFNSVGVKNYPNYQAGLQATVATLRNGFYPHLEAALHDNIDENLGDNLPEGILEDLHTWSGNPNGYGEGLPTLGVSHLNDAFDYGTSSNNHPTAINLPTDIQISEAIDRWHSFIPDCPTGTGIYNSWLSDWINKERLYGPPLTNEKHNHNWDNAPIVYQIFAHATCEWVNGNANWYDGRGKIE